MFNSLPPYVEKHDRRSKWLKDKPSTFLKLIHREVITKKKFLLLGSDNENLLNATKLENTSDNENLLNATKLENTSDNENLLNATKCR